MLHCSRFHSQCSRNGDAMFFFLINNVFSTICKCFLFSNYYIYIYIYMCIYIHITNNIYTYIYIYVETTSLRCICICLITTTVVTRLHCSLFHSQYSRNGVAMFFFFKLIMYLQPYANVFCFRITTYIYIYMCIYIYNKQYIYIYIYI